ncbi:hypothetical protein DAPPUDRAFT_233986 [Daphnia pulex]|uniref:Uncharacterized protein n=1 Tax=Daphnia pulex TaxID=6669 RepID=E9FU99_DAPPU|nr:hypothetical protein DAPPUDRAFT_233986 [Daphnia pulex]|eukprot:EFX88959.1 hypothetical protein DAPPUDRAFT_233986 [Daphnia pulex]
MAPRKVKKTSGDHEEPGPFYENMELHFSHAIQVLHPIVQNARKPHLALL